jgi:flagellar hook capping protein FlgD
VSDRPGTRGTALGAALFAVLAVLAVAGFAVTRAARSGDDLVNSVELTPAKFIPGGPDGDARIAFRTAEADDSVDVLIIDGEPGGDDAQVRALALGEDLEAGEHVYRWDGHADDGDLAPPGLYALEVVLGEDGRDILPPGRIEIPEPELPLSPAKGDSPGEGGG